MSLFSPSLPKIAELTLTKRRVGNNRWEDLVIEEKIFFDITSDELYFMIFLELIPTCLFQLNTYASRRTFLEYVEFMQSHEGGIRIANFGAGHDINTEIPFNNIFTIGIRAKQQALVIEFGTFWQMSRISNEPRLLALLMYFTAEVFQKNKHNPIALEFFKEIVSALTSKTGKGLVYNSESSAPIEMYNFTMPIIQKYLNKIQSKSGKQKI